MKKLSLIIIIGIVAFLSVLNFQMASKYVKGDVSLEMLEIMSIAYAGEIGEVTITCSSGNEGQCFTEGDPDYSIGPFGLPMCETTCDFTGSQSDHCVAGVPC